MTKQEFESKASNVRVAINGIKNSLEELKEQYKVILKNKKEITLSIDKVVETINKIEEFLDERCERLEKYSIVNEEDIKKLEEFEQNAVEIRGQMEYLVNGFKVLAFLERI